MGLPYSSIYFYIVYQFFWIQNTHIISFFGVSFPWLVKERMLSIEPFSCLCSSRDGTACDTLIVDVRFFSIPQIYTINHEYWPSSPSTRNECLIVRRTLCFLRASIKPLLLHFFVKTFDSRPPATFVFDDEFISSGTPALWSQKEHGRAGFVPSTSELIVTY